MSWHINMTSTSNVKKIKHTLAWIAFIKFFSLTYSMLRLWCTVLSVMNFSSNRHSLDTIFIVQNHGVWINVSAVTVERVWQDCYESRHVSLRQTSYTFSLGSSQFALGNNANVVAHHTMYLWKFWHAANVAFHK